MLFTYEFYIGDDAAIYSSQVNFVVCYSGQDKSRSLHVFTTLAFQLGIIFTPEFCMHQTPLEVLEKILRDDVQKVSLFFRS